MATAARGEGRQIVAFIADQVALSGDGRATLSSYGVARIVHIRTGVSAWDPVIGAAAVTAAMQHFEIDHLIGLSTPAGRELLPRIAARLDAPLTMDCTEIDLDRHRAVTSQYSGKTVATFDLKGNPCIYGLRANVTVPRKDPVRAESLDFEFTGEHDQRYRVIATRSAGQAQNLAEAEIIISGGRGMQSGENFKLLRDCAKHMGAAVGASRVAVDNGWVPYAMQVGQTGVKVNPKVYLAVGISGSVQHFAGMKSARMIIAINSDENAPIMANCDYYAVGDLFQILPELEKALKVYYQEMGQ
jgi:electron transfer flavoprotein alpha subunit